MLRGTTRPVSVAPMMDRTDRHFRFLVRCISKHTLLYTEMLHARAVLHGDRDRLLGFDPEEHPISLQIGGDDPVTMTEAARIAEDRGYDEVNLNIGCPSPRVQSGNFGACLMRDPERVAACVAAMRSAVSIPVTVKTRIGVDDWDRYEHMLHFVDTVSAAGSDRITVHARKAWLQGLSPKQNRNIPPLRYPEVYRLKQERPELVVEINGGIKTLDDFDAHLEHVDAVMIGRAAWDNPMLFAEVDRRYFGGTDPVPTAAEVVERYAPYAQRWLARPGYKATRIHRNLLNLFAGRPGAKRWKQALSTGRPTAEPLTALVPQLS